MIHHFPEDFVFEEPAEFTDPFRYMPHPAVREAARLTMERIDSDTELKYAFSEGKMLGVLVCRPAKGQRQTCFISAFSGNVGGKSSIDGFVPPIFDLTDPDGEFKRREAEISELNHEIERLLDSDRLLCLEREVADAESGCRRELTAMKEVMAASKLKREKIRSERQDPDTLQSLIKESQHEKAEYKRLKVVLDEVVANAHRRLEEYHKQVESLKRQRASMSEELQEWIFKQYIVCNASGEPASIHDIFTSKGLVPPGGTGECAAPKLLQYAFTNGLEPLAMGEFWYGTSPQTAVRTHGHFYPSCTSKCGPLLKYMLNGISTESPDLQLYKGISPAIIFEDKEIIVVEKPSGMPSVPGLDGRTSMQEHLEHIYGQTIHAVHRLDMDTSGIMLFAKTHQAAINLRRQFEDHTVRKTYIARVSGTVIETGRIRLPLSPDYDERPRQKVDIKQGKPACTEYEIASKNPDGTTDLLLYPHTGRTHQLRVHCAHTLGLGCPIIGDMLYGGAPASRLHLHALSITFEHPSSCGSITFTSKNLCF